MDQVADAVCDDERAAILEGEDEGSHCGGAEILSSQRHLNVSVLIQELDEAVATVEAAADSAGGALGHRVISAPLLELLLKVLENDADDPDDSKDEGAQCKGAQVVAEGPPESFENAETTS